MGLIHIFLAPLIQGLCDIKIWTHWNIVFALFWGDIKESGNKWLIWNTLVVTNNEPEYLLGINIVGSSSTFKLDCDWELPWWRNPSGKLWNCSFITKFLKRNYVKFVSRECVKDEEIHSNLTHLRNPWMVLLFLSLLVISHFLCRNQVDLER